MKQRTKRLLSWVLTLVMVVGLVPGMSLTALADDTTGTQLTADTTNPLEGTYYLNSDVALNSEMQITSGNVVINLNGHTLSLKSGAKSWQSVIYVAGGNLTVNGGKISGGTGGHNQRGGGFHIDGGDVTVNDVDITNNKGAWGGGVFINGGSGTFTMNNSHIRNNTSVNDDEGHGWNDAGGAYLDGGVFTINGGSITDNKVEGNKKNGLVLANSYAELNISGDVLIYNNKVGDTQENLHADALFGGASPINITDSLGDNAKIGITSKWHQVFTSSVNTDNNDPTKFVSDSSEYRVGRNTDGQLMLAKYNEIIYKTTGYDGVYDGQEHGIKVVASDPDTATIRYGTSADSCTMEQSPVFKDVGENSVYYEITAPVSEDEINYEPVQGSAVVKINKATPSINDFKYEEPSDLTYDGSAKAATVVSTQSGTGKVTVKYYSDPELKTEVQSPTDVGTYYVGITAEEGTIYSAVSTVLHDASWQFTINKQAAPASLNDNQKPTANTGLTYTGNEQELVTAPTELPVGYIEMQYALGEDATNAPAADAEGTPAEDRKWSTTIPTGTDAGTYHVWYKVIGDRNHNDTAPECVDASIRRPATSKVNIARAEVTADSASFAYDGSPKEPALKVVLGGRELAEGTDYVVSFSGNVEAGTATATVTGKGRYTGAAKATFAIEPADVSKAQVKLEQVSFAYDGNAKEPAVASVVLDGRTLEAGTDYEVAYRDNTAAGTARAVVTGKGNYEGTVEAAFSIEQPKPPVPVRTDISKAKVTLAKKKLAYDGKAQEPAVVSVVLNGKTLAAGTDYAVTYEGNTEPGTATAIVTGKGAYEGAARAAFKVVLKRAKLSTTSKPAAGSLAANWAAIPGAEGYELQWREPGGQWQAKSVSATSATVKGLKPGSLCDVRVRAVAGKSKGAWSPVRHRWLARALGVTAKPGERGSVDVTWKASPDATAGYLVVARYAKGGKNVAKLKVAPGNTSATFTGLKSGKKVWVLVAPLRTDSGKTFRGVLSHTTRSTATVR